MRRVYHADLAGAEAWARIAACDRDRIYRVDAVALSIHDDGRAELRADFGRAPADLARAIAGGRINGAFADIHADGARALRGRFRLRLLSGRLIGVCDTGLRAAGRPLSVRQVYDALFARFLAA